MNPRGVQTTERESPPWFLLAQVVVLLGGVILLSHATNQIGRSYLAVPFGVIGGLVLASAVYWFRARYSSRRVDLAAVVYLLVLALVSLSLDWFDARSVLPSSAILMIAMVRRPPTTAASSFSRAASILANTAVGVLLFAATALAWLTYGGSSGDQTLV